MLALRVFPKVTIAQTLVVQERLKSGIHPYEAIEMTEAEARHYIGMGKQEYGDVYAEFEKLN